MAIRKSPAAGTAPPLVVRTEGSGRSLTAGPAYLVGRDPLCDIVISDPRVSWQHAVLRVEDGRWTLADNGSTNGIYAGESRVDRIEITGECLVRLSDPADGPALSCAPGDTAPSRQPLLKPGPAAPGRGPGLVWPLPAGTSRIGRAPDNDIVVPDLSVSSYHAELRQVAGGYHIADLDSRNGTFVNERRVTAAALSDGDIVGLGSSSFRLTGRELREISSDGDGEAHGDGPLEIPYAVRWLVPRGERFANFGLLNDNDTQLGYYRRFGHIYAVGIPTKKWRLVVVSDPELLDEVAADEERFGKRVEEINFFDQLSNSRGGGISVIGDGEHYERIRRVMLPWYSPAHQRTQLERMKEQARKLVAAWSAIPDDEPLDARAWLERYALEVSGRGACAYDFGLLDGHGASGDPHPFAAAVPASTKESILRAAEPRPDFTLLAGRARRARRKAYRRHNEELFRTAGALVRARMHTCPLGQQTDLLSRLVSTPDPQTGELLDAETIRDQVLMHLSNGFNGPSITAAWLAYVLATHPDVEEKLIAEIDGITGGDPGYDLRYDDLMALTYTTQVIKETMRIYPPLPVTIRRSLKDGTLGRYRIRKGDIILVGALAAQRDPRYWGPEPDRFDPEHFAMEKVAGRPQHAFIPFSIGKRQCMAQEVTFMMLRVVLFEIYRHYRLRIAPGAAVTKNTVVSTKPAAVPVTRLPRERDGRPQAAVARRDRPAGPAPAPAPARASGPARDWGEPTEIPGASAYRHLVIAYGSNFGASKELAEHRDADVTLPRRRGHAADERAAGRSGAPAVAGAARAGDPHQPGRNAHGRGARPGLPGTPGGRVAETDPASGDQPAARRRLPGRRPPRRVPEERRGTGRAAGPAPRRHPGRPVHGAEDDERPRRAQGRRAPGQERPHQPHRHHRPADGTAARPAAGEGSRPRRTIQARPDQGRPAGAGRSRFAAARGDRRGGIRRAPAAR